MVVLLGVEVPASKHLSFGFRVLLITISLSSLCFMVSGILLISPKSEGSRFFPNFLENPFSIVAPTLSFLLGIFKVRFIEVYFAVNKIYLLSGSFKWVLTNVYSYKSVATNSISSLIILFISIYISVLCYFYFNFQTFGTGAL